MKANILIIDDEAGIRTLVRDILDDEGYGTATAATDSEAYAQFDKLSPDLVILDIWLQNSAHDGLEILKRIRAKAPGTPVLMMSGHGTIETAVSAIKLGAYDFIEKPFTSDRLLILIERALEAASLRRENEALKAKSDDILEFIGDTPAMQSLKTAMERVAQTNSRILLTGEAGTGKDLAASAIHRLSKRAAGPYKILNCAVLHPDRLETELFGTVDENGARHKGVLEQAHGGTLLLDEIADMPLETQGKIVRVLQDQRFLPIGSQKETEVDVRIIASTNGNLEEAIRKGLFRQDLYYRLNVVPLTLPPLRDRVRDIEKLVGQFVALYSRQSGLPPCRFSPEAIGALQSYDWPGNVRQLRNTVEWLMIMHRAANDGEVIGVQHLPPEICPDNKSRESRETYGHLMFAPLREAREIFERDYLLSQIRRFDGNISKTAEFVGMERSALHRKLKQLGVPASYRPEAGAEDIDKSAAFNGKGN